MQNLAIETEQEITEGYGLSPQQRHLWLLQKNEKTGIYLAQCTISIPGKIDLSILKLALKKIVERHEIFRTNFDSLPGMIVGVQIISESNIYSEKEYDLTQVEPTQQTAEVAKIWGNLAQNFFDLKKDSLFHVSTVKISPEQQTLLITLPALIADSKSLQILVDELNQEYVACLEGNELSEAELQYADIAEWQNQLLEAEEAKLGKEYWEKQDISNRFNLKLPFEKQSEEFQPKIQKNIIDSDLAAKVENIAKQLDISRSGFFLTCWLTLIWRLTGKLNLVVGLVGDGRKYEDLEQALGLFAKHLPFSFQVQEDLKFNELLEQVKASISDILKWQDYFTWEQFIPTTENYSEQSFIPLSFEFLELNNISQNSDFKIDRIYTCIDKYKIKLVINQNQNLTAEFHYDANAYNAEDIQRLTEQFEVLLASVVENPVAEISKLKINASHHLEQLLIEFNQTQEFYPQDKCIHQLFEEQVEKNPNAVAVVFEKQELTYQQLNAKANQLAHYLQSLGVKPETLVGICINRSLEMIVGLLGILKAGGAYVPIDPSYPTERLAYMLEDAAMPVLLTSESVLELLPEHSAQVVCLDSNWDTIANQSIENLVSGVTPDNLAYVIYTSGSTGKPKGTMIIHRGVVNYLSWCTAAYQVKEGNGVPVNSSIGFDATVTAFFSPLLTGKEMILLPEGNEIEALKELLCSQRNLSLVKLTPAHLQILNTLIPPEKASEQTRAFIIGGEALPATTVSFWSNNAPQTKLINEYGPTETVVGCCVYQVKPEDSLKEVIPIGCPIANTQLYILDQHQQPVPLGVPGELYIGGAGLARGYLNRPDLTAAKFIPNPFDNNSRLYKTGDLSRYLSDGTIEYLGRIDNQIKIRGFRIELGEIESVLSSHPQVQQTVVVCREDTPGNKQLVAYIVAVEGTQEITELRSYLVSKLPEYMVPSAFVFLDVLPLTPNGKVDRKALPAPDDLTNSLEYVPPQNPTQEIITNIFAGVLGITKVGIHDNFFSLGGHSLLATQVISRIRQYLEVEIAFKTLFEFPTAAELAQNLSELRATNSGFSLPPIQPRTQNEKLPLSWAQERLWFINQLEGPSATYNIPAAVRINGKLDINALQQVLSEIVRRHEVLRTSFQTQDGKPIQVIDPLTTININMVNLQQLEAKEQETIVLQEAQTEAITPFNLEVAPLIRYSLLQLSTTEYVLLLTMHHIVSDGWSIGVFIRELSSLYQAFAQGEPSPLPELAIQYADFTIWQREYLSGEIRETQLNYWKEYLANAPELLQLPTDRSRPTVQTYQGSAQSYTFNTDLTKKLQAFSQERGTTLFMTLFAAFATLLYRYSSQSDILIGSPIANRNRSEIESLIGFFINTLVLRTAFVDNPNFEELLVQVRETTLKAYQYQDVPFEQVVEAVQPQRSLSHSPLFQVMFILQNAPMGKVELPGITLSPLNLENTIAKFDLMLSMTETEEELVGRWTYNTDLFDGSTIERMASHFENLLLAILENPLQKVNKLPLLSAAERNQLLVEWNNTAVEYPKDKCIHQLFEAQVEKTPDAVAVVFEGEQLTYQQLNESANQLAHYLQSLGVKPETLVGICVERSVEMVVGLLGILKAGGAYVPIDPTYPAERLSYMLEDAAVSVLLSSESVWQHIPTSSAQVVCLDKDWDKIATSSSIENLDSGVTQENLAYTIYTSGSTGNPKGCMNTHAGIYNRLLWMQDTYQLTAQDRILQKTPFSFDVSVWEFFWPLLTGATLVVALPEIHKDSEALISLIIEQEITTIHFVPSMLSVFLQGLKIEECSSLKRVICSGEALSYQLQEQFQEKLKCELHNLYGPTEAAIDVTFIDCGTNKYPGIVPIGRPIANTQLYILDSNNQPVPIGVSGELHIGGAGLARGYLNRPELTAEKFIPNPFDNNNSQLYKTGDLTRYLPDGNIEYLGRIDNQIKLRGFRIELGEIEALLNTHSQIQQTVVIAREDIPGNKRLVAYVVTSDESLIPKELREFVQQKLPEYMVPSAFVNLESLPLTPNGKIDRKALPAPGDISPEQEYVPPSTAIEKTLTKIWQELLIKEKIGIHDNFFEIGGDSILSIQVVSRARNLGIEITPKQIFQNQTIAKLATVANTTTKVQCKQGIVTGVAPLIPIQKWFLSKNQPEAYHFNQSVFLQIPNNIKPELLEKAVEKLIEHHDVLRLRFTSEQQINHGLVDKIPFTVVDLSSTAISSQPQAIEEVASEYQASFNLSDRPIIQVVMFNLGSEVDARLLIIIHHLAVDGVSWRILLSDLETIYQQLVSEKLIKLDAKTTAFIDFAQKLDNYAQSEIIKQELDYWVDQPWSQTSSIPVDYADTQLDNTVDSIARVSVKLNPEETRILLKSVNEAYNTQINDILMSALVMSLAEWTGNLTVLIDLEGHGREELFSDVDLSRTVGWFTSLFPVLLQVPEDNKIASVIKSVKEKLRAIPNRGIGYGILRYLCQDTTVTDQLHRIPTPEIIFNYLGQFNQGQSTTGWQPATESTGSDRSPKLIRDHLLEINSLIAQGEFQINWTYSSNVHTHSTVERLAEGYLKAIRAIIEHCQSEDAFGYTPSDFPDAQLNQSEVDELLAVVKTKNISSIYPLSPMQQGMLFHSLYAPDSGMYFQQMAISLQGKLDIPALKSAWQKVIDRHSVLRTFFVWKNRPTPLQVVLNQVDVNWTNLDWIQLSPNEQEHQLKELLLKQKQQGFSLDKAPLLDCTLIHMGVDTYKFIWNHHHILMDGWSSPIIFQEVLSFYEARGNQTIQLPTPPPYSDHIAWLYSQSQEAARNFWQQTLQGFETPTSLKISARGNQEESNYQEIKLRLSSECSQKLQSLAKQNRVTLSTIVQAAWALLLSRYSDETDVVFGVTVSGRNSGMSGVENMVGLLINTLPLRVKIPSDSQFIPWLEQIQELMVELQQYSYTPLVEIQALSEVSGGTSLFESIVIFENYPIDSSLANEQHSLQLGKIESFEKTNYPLTVFAVPGDELLVRIGYDSANFESDTIERMLGHLQNIFEAIVENPTQEVSELSLLSATERHQLLMEWNNTAVEYPKNQYIHQLFEEQVETTPDAVAVIFKNEQLTYQQLNQKANQLAHYLQTLGVGADTLVGVCLERSVEMVIGLLATLKAGGAYVPIDPNYPPERISLMLSDSQASVLLTQKHLAASLPEVQARVLCIDTEETFTHQSSENLASNIDTENLAYVIYTSGSTGKPKGVQIPHRTLLNFLTSMQQQPGITRDDVLLAVTTISFDIAGLEIYLPLISGARLVLASRDVATNGKQLAELISGSVTTMMQATPATWRLLLATGWQGSENFKILCGGEALPTDLARELLSCSNSVWNMYGPTETTIWSTVCQVKASQLEMTSMPIGRPIANTQIYILDSTNQPVPMGVAGELHIGGAGLAYGYLHRQELTTEKFIANPFDNNNSRLYKTGDLARYLPDGNIEYFGRIDNQVKIRGFRIELGEIEVVLNQHPAVQQTVVTAQEYNSGDKRLVAYLVCDSQEPTTEELRSFVKEQLPDYMIPSAFVILEAFPLTPNGKINRRALKPPTDLGVSEHSFVPPSTPVEKQLAAIWSEVLGIEKVGIHDNFFDIGGHSLLIIQVQNRLQEIFSSNVTIADLFRNPTIKTLAQIVEQTPATQTPESKLIQPVSRQLKLPLSFSQQRLWFIDQFEKTAAYNMLSSVRLHGAIDLDVLEQAFTEMIRRHEVLRTSFQVVGEEPAQIISDTSDFNLSVIDLRELPQPRQEEQVQELGLSQAGRPFDLSKNPLLRVSVVQLADKEYVLVFVIHHIISDELSMGIMIKELATLYDAFSRGMPSPLPDLSIQYADFAYWQRQYLQGDLFTKQLAYWQQQLAGVPKILALPTDKPRPKVQSFQGATTKFELPLELSESIKKVSQSEGVTLFMMLLTGFQILLYCYSQQQDFCIGSPIANRNQRETEGIMGFFINTLVLRANSSGNPSFRELLQRVRETAIGAFAHQDLPFEKLLEELEIERSLSHNPLFQVWFVFNNVPMSTLEMPEFNLTPLQFDNGLARHDIRLGIWETATGFSGSFQYKTDLFDAETINSMVKDLEVIFVRLVADVDMKLSEMSDIIQDSQKQKQILQKQELEKNNRQKLKKMKRKSAF